MFITVKCISEDHFDHVVNNKLTEIPDCAIATVIINVSNICTVFKSMPKVIVPVHYESMTKVCLVNKDVLFCLDFPFDVLQS